MITQDDLHRIYGTDNDLEKCCISSGACWRSMEHARTHEAQVPYLPYIGCKYRGILFSGINLNGVMGSSTAISDLVHQAINEYLVYKRYLIFKSAHYRGSPFYYYVPLLSYLYEHYTSGGIRVEIENEVSFPEIIDGFKYCGLTNLIKCSVKSNGFGTPNPAMFGNCIPKFKQELCILKPKVLIVFTYRRLPNLAQDYWNDFVIRSTQADKYRIQSKHNTATDPRYLLELGHPVSPRISRSDKFKNYSSAIFDLVQMMKHDKENQ